MNNDTLESLLRSAGNSEPLPAKASPDLTERVLRTVAERQKRRQRRIVAAGLVGCYLGGVLTAWLCLSPASTTTNTAAPMAQQRIDSSPRTVPAATVNHPARPRDERAAETVVADAPHLDAWYQEARRSQKKTLYELFRELGDASHARGDFVSAVRNYRLALDSASEADFHSGTGQDNLLLLSLKQDRIEHLPQENQGESL